MLLGKFEWIYQMALFVSDEFMRVPLSILGVVLNGKQQRVIHQVKLVQQQHVHSHLVHYFVDVLMVEVQAVLSFSDRQEVCIF